MCLLHKHEFRSSEFVKNSGTARCVCAVTLPQHCRTERILLPCAFTGIMETWVYISVLLNYPSSSPSHFQIYVKLSFHLTMDRLKICILSVSQWHRYLIKTICIFPFFSLFIPLPWAADIIVTVFSVPILSCWVLWGKQPRRVQQGARAQEKPEEEGEKGGEEERGTRNWARSSRLSDCINDGDDLMSWLWVRLLIFRKRAQGEGGKPCKLETDQENWEA